MLIHLPAPPPSLIQAAPVTVTPVFGVKDQVKNAINQQGTVIAVRITSGVEWDTVEFTDHHKGLPDVTYSSDYKASSLVLVSKAPTD